MKKIIFIGLVIVFSTSCTGQWKKYSHSDFNTHQIEFDTITFTVDPKVHDTLLYEGILKHETLIEGIPCNGSVTLAKGWKLKHFTLAEDHVFGTCTFPKNTTVESDIVVDRERGIKYWRVFSGCKTLTYCTFQTNYIINGINCMAGEPVYFRPDWTLAGCILAEDDTIGVSVLPKLTLIRFEKDEIDCFCLTDPVIQGYRCKGRDYRGSYNGGDGISLYRSGMLKYFRPFDEIIEVQGVLCKHSATYGGIWLHENGKLKRCNSAIDQTIDGVFCKKGYRLEFDENGKLIEAKRNRFWGG